PGRAFLTGGATAVLHGWRASTIDVDVVFRPESDALLRAIPALKEGLELNVELASPAHFIPELPGWEESPRPWASFSRASSRCSTATRRSTRPTSGAPWTRSSSRGRRRAGPRSAARRGGPARPARRARTHRARGP